MSQLKVQQLDGILVVDSRLVAWELGIKHKNFLATIEKYKTEIEQDFGHLAFETETVTNSVGAVNEIRFAFLNEDQSIYLMTLSRNTVKVRQCKRNLVKAFVEAKKIITEVIPAQNSRIRELELQVELAKLNNNWIEHITLLSQLHGAPTTMALMGRSDAVVEIEKPTIEIIDERHNQPIKFKGQTLKQVQEYLKQKHGIKFKNGADIKRKLKRLGREDLVAQTLRSIAADYIPDEYLEEAYQLLSSGKRQLILGEG